jgi:quinol monooxygenase YgiN
MITLTALIRCKPGSESHVRTALLRVARHAADSEDGTASYFVSESAEGNLFVTHERYLDQACLDAHNNGEGAKAFFAAVEGLLEDVQIVSGPELFASE